MNAGLLTESHAEIRDTPGESVSADARATTFGDEGASFGEGLAGCSLRISERCRSRGARFSDGSCAPPTWLIELRAIRFGASSFTMAAIMASRSAISS